MARVTVEDCVKVVSNRFELCLVASSRAKNILSGSATELDKKEKPAVIALREIGDNLINVETIKQNILASIKNHGNSENANFVGLGTTSEMIAEEVHSQVLKDTTFISENIQVDD